jgi:predicted peptidase
MRDKLFACCVFVLYGLIVGQSTSALDLTDFADFSLRSGPTTLLPGRLYIPPEAANDLRPLIVFLHGGGAAGTNNISQLNQDVEQLSAEAERREAYLYVPQAPLNWRPRTITDRVMTMIDRSLTDYKVDATRLYLTGYSSGGGGTWNMLSRYPGRFAAAVPVAPVSAEPDFNPANLVGQPIAAFHARNDAVASVNITRNVINSILTAAHEPLPSYPSFAAPDFNYSVPELDLHYVEPAGGGHSVLFSVYNRPQVYEWMFAHGAVVPEPSGSALTFIVTMFGINWTTGFGRKKRSL